MIERITSNILPKKMHGFLTKNYILNKEKKIILDYKNLFKSFSFERKALLEHLSEEQKIKFDNLHFLNQTHSSKVVELKKLKFDEQMSADAMVSNIPGTTLCVFTADCAPIIFFESKNKIIAIAHVGWKGALNGIIKNTIEKMTKIGANRREIIAIIGPCISQKNYEVKKDFVKDFISRNNRNIIFFEQTKENKIFFNLPAYLEKLLLKETINKFQFTKICTFDNEDKFYSFRKNNNEKGRFLSYISLID